MGDTLPERVSLRTIAEQANVSRMTVSLALRDQPVVAKNTRKRIQKIAAQLGYRPDPKLARVMATIGTVRKRRAPDVLAFLTAFESRDWRRQRATARMFYEGAARRAAECGYELREFRLCEPGMNDRRLGEILHHRGIEGIIVAPVPDARVLFSDFPWQRFSAVALGYSLSRPQLHRCSNHQAQSIFLLVQTLHALGYRRIGVAMSLDQDERVHHNWRAGFLAAVNVLPGIGGKAPLLLTADWNRDTFARWLEQNRPDVVITVGPDVAAWLRALRRRVPQDIGLANVDLSPDLIGTVTGVNQNSRLVGAAAVDLLVPLVQHGSVGVPAVPRILMIEGTFVVGSTTVLREGSHT